MNIRKITSMTMVWSLIVLVFNSIVLYVVPEGRIANWADWKFWGLTKHDWSAQHTTVGFLFIFAGLLHIYYNWNPIISYLKSKARKLTFFTTASNIGLGLTVIFVIGTYLNIPPMSTIVELSEDIKAGAATKYGDPPYGQAQSSSLKGFTSRLGLDLEKTIVLLENAGIAITDEKEMIQDIAARSSNTPQQIYDIIKSAGLQPSNDPTQQPETSSAGTMQVPKSGMGKKTITQICDEIGKDCDLIIAGLEKRGMNIDPNQKLKELASQHDTGPMQIYETIVEILSESE